MHLYHSTVEQWSRKAQATKNSVCMYPRRQATWEVWSLVRIPPDYIKSTLIGI